MMNYTSELNWNFINSFKYIVFIERTIDSVLSEWAMSTPILSFVKQTSYLCKLLTLNVASQLLSLFRIPSHFIFKENQQSLLII